MLFRSALQKNNMLSMEELSGIDMGIPEESIDEEEQEERNKLFPEALNLASYIHSPDHSTIGTRSPLDGLSVLVSTRFQVLFHSPPGVLFTFPSQYSSLSVTE